MGWFLLACDECTPRSGPFGVCGRGVRAVTPRSAPHGAAGVRSRSLLAARASCEILSVRREHERLMNRDSRSRAVGDREGDRVLGERDITAGIDAWSRRLLGARVGLVDRAGRDDLDLAAQ